MKIRTKIILGFSIPILMFGAFGLWLHFAMASASEQLRHAKEESVVFALIAKGMRTHVAQVQQYLTDISATRGLDGLDDGLKDAETHYKEFIDDLVKFEQMFTAEGDQIGLESCKQVRIKSDEFYAIGVKMAHAYIDKGTAAGNKLMPDFDKKSLELQNILSPFIKTQLDELDTAVEVAGSNATKTRIATVIIATGVAIATFALWPICVPLTATDVASFQPPIDQRTDTDFYLQIFQRKDGQWCQCKTRISRAMFF